MSLFQATLSVFIISLTLTLRRHSKGEGYDYVDYIDEINARYWELTSNKLNNEIESKLKQIYDEDYMKELIRLDFNSEADLFLSRYIPRDVEGKKLGNKNTYDQYKRGLTKLIEFMLASGIGNINEMTLPVLDRLQDDLLRQYSAKTTQGYLGVVKEFFYFLQNRGLLKSNDFVSFKIITVDKRDQKKPTLTESEIARVMSHVMTLPDTPLIIIDKLIMLIMVNTGVREEELCKIQVKDIVKQDKNLVIHVHGKGMRKRFVVLSPEVSAKLIDLRFKLENAIMAPLVGDDYLIQSMAKNTRTKNLQPIHRTSICTRISDISNEVGVYFTAHALRRTLATLLYKRSTPIEVIQRILGHESATTTQGYIDLEIDKQVGLKYAISMVG